MKDIDLEILKLLLQVAWADHEVSADEIEHILGLAAEADMDTETVALLASCLRGETQLPAPDIGLLRAHKERALIAAHKLIVSDEAVGDDEKAAFVEIKALLDG